MADWVAVEMPSNLLTASEGETTYWVVDTVGNTDSATGKVYGDVLYRCSSRTRAIRLAEWLNTPTP